MIRRRKVRLRSKRRVSTVCLRRTFAGCLAAAVSPHEHLLQRKYSSQTRVIA